MSKPTMTFTPKNLTLWAGLSLGLMLPLTVLADRTVSYTYTVHGQVETIDGPRVDVTDVTTYGYDEQGNRNSITNALNQTTQITAHDASGRPLTIVSPNGLTTTRSYDLRGRMIQQTVSDGTTSRTTDYDYDAVGNLIQVTLPDGNSISYDYDAAHRLTGLEDQLGNRIDYTLDDMGNRLSEEVSDPTGTLTRTKQQVYDQLSQLDQSIDSENHATDFDYDPNGNLTRTLDANLNPTAQAYDPLNRLSQTTDTKNGITQYSYDAQDNLTQVTDPTGLVTSYDYDALGDLISLTSPDTGVTTYNYDEAGNRLTQTDARNVTTSYSYDALNRLTGISYPDTSLNVSYTYDQGTHGIGQLTQMSDAEGTTDYQYNAFGELTQVTRTSQDGVITTFSYSYNPQGQLASQSYPSGHSVHYSYAQGQLTGLSLERPDGTTQSLVSQIQRLPFGPINALTFGNGLQLSRTFDQDYQLIAQALGNVLDDSYGHDPVGNITSWLDLVQTARDQTFSYDELDRLTSAIGAYGSLGYSYDPIGNRLTKTEDGVSETYNYILDTHRLEEILGTTTDSRQYDAAGNIISSLLGSYTYDDQNRMVVFSKTGTAASYGYNGKGERIRKTVDGVVTRFRFGPSGALLGEYDLAGQVIREYVYLEGQPVAQLQGTVPVQVSYLHTDHLGAVVKATDETGSVVWDSDRRPFGERVETVAQVEMPLGFPGQYYDQETGNYYNYFRDYDPATGRYLESDPIGLEGGLNTYAYVGNNPILRSDSRGLRWGPGEWGGTHEDPALPDFKPCQYYNKKCEETGCTYYCRTAPFVCTLAHDSPYFLGYGQTKLNCIRKCLVEEDKKANEQSYDTDICKDDCLPNDVIDDYHKTCFLQCGADPNDYPGVQPGWMPFELN
ncbi:MAG: RHS domain-containing protein [Candidatus Thiodiazotropha lotti]|nr:RHS domain-containing protein [Candidatus Thiodiazotropha lotti]MCG8004615.1 RHS domain-containing protein [Candidatus Thiodiazotropha lotti]MCG8006633.1 RHS domain-containing protein [Candidatus Thiodiazotropha lotti]MCW4188242.1 RHS domain-containing protein [Candidatus Thiodiazotropha lotti]MCW4194215.1 RHS domain-containing protein [Candidatus Thiodiazotropha lotti]